MKPPSAEKQRGVECHESPRISPDGCIFLDISRPYVAWAAYKGTLITPPNTGTQDGRFVSWWVAGLLRNTQNLARELALEQVRAQHFPERISRLIGIFCFLDESCANQAICWGEHFKAENRVEISLVEARGRDRLDANWITKADPVGVSPNDAWITRYWQGEPYPNVKPVWETLVDGRVTVLGTRVRERAYQVVKGCWPDSLLLLEIARLGAWTGSDIGSISAFMANGGEDYRFTFGMDMRDANDAGFLTRLDKLMKSGHPVNWADIGPHYEAGSFGRRPDMTSYQFRCPKNIPPPREEREQ